MWLNNRNLFLTVLESEKFKIKVPKVLANSISSEGPVPGLQIDILLCFHTGGREGERERIRSS